MPSVYELKILLAVIALGLAVIPFGHSAWHYYRASKLDDDPPGFKARRMAAAYEWRGWKIVCTGLALIINTIVDILPG
jgi:hypothetical protein